MDKYGISWYGLKGDNEVKLVRNYIYSNWIFKNQEYYHLANEKSAK